MAQETLSRPTVYTGRLLAGGIVAGPVFLAVWLVQAVSRAGFDPTRHPLSLLSLGELGWIQVTNFVVCGLLYVATAVGLRRVLRPGRGGTWAPLLVGLNGLGLIMAGVFTTDPGAGFPPGAPDGAPERVSVHGVLHEVGFAVASVSWIAACFVLARRFADLRERGWVWVCRATPVAVLAVVAWPDLDSLSMRLVVGTAIQFGFMLALAIRMRRAGGY